jgi:hypothetical protein
MREKGISVINATPGSLIEEFERVSLDQAFVRQYVTNSAVITALLALIFPGTMF